MRQDVITKGLVYAISTVSIQYWTICFLVGQAWFPYDRNGRKNRVTIFLNGQFIIVCTCKPHTNHKLYSLVIITPRIFSSEMLYSR
jgi:hypothetical protein